MPSFAPLTCDCGGFQNGRWWVYVETFNRLLSISLRNWMIVKIRIIDYTERNKQQLTIVMKPCIHIQIELYCRVDSFEVGWNLIICKPIPSVLLGSKTGGRYEHFPLVKSWLNGCGIEMATEPSTHHRPFWCPARSHVHGAKLGVPLACLPLLPPSWEAAGLWPMKWAVGLCLAKPLCFTLFNMQVLGINFLT